MNKTTVLKIGGVVAIVAGSVALFLSGTSESVVGAVVAAVFVLAGIVAGMFKIEKK